MTYEFFILAAAFLWCGSIIAISFMEAWLKFRAPGITVPLGLGIGKLIFKALNRMEWIFLAIVLVSYILAPITDKSLVLSGFGILLVILFVQTVWLLPVLDARAAALISGKALSKSRLHILFVICELAKVVILITVAWRFFQLVMGIS